MWILRRGSLGRCIVFRRIARQSSRHSPQLGSAGPPGQRYRWHRSTLARAAINGRKWSLCFRSMLSGESVLSVLPAGHLLLPTRDETAIVPLDKIQRGGSPPGGYRENRMADGCHAPNC